MKPLRIVHVANRQEKYIGMRDYATPVKINNGFIREGHQVRFFSDRETARALSPFNSRVLGVGATNKQLILLCRNFEPDVIAFCQADIIRPQTLEEIRAFLPDVAILQYELDPLCLDSNRDRMRRYGDVADHAFTTTGGHYLAEVAGNNAPIACIPNPVDPSIDVHRNHERDDLPTDVFMAGNRAPWNDPQSLRRLAPDVLETRLSDLTREVFGSPEQPRIWGTEFVRTIGRAKIGLNFSNHTPGLQRGDGGPLYLYSSDRISQIIGNGLLVITEALAQLNEMYGKDAIVEVETPDELVDRIRYYARNDAERRKIAARGYEVAHAEFNERLVCRFMLEKTLGRALSRQYMWPTTSHFPPAKSNTTRC